MITMARAEKGIRSYIDREIVDIAVNMFLQNVIVRGGYLTDDGMVEEGRLFNALLEVANEKGCFTGNLPVIGDIKFTYRDVEKLYEMICS